MTRRAVMTAVVLAVLGVAGCGVDTDDRPKSIEDTSIQQTPATPSVDTQPAPEPSTSTTPSSRQSSPPPLDSELTRRSDAPPSP